MGRFKILRSIFIGIILFQLSLGDISLAQDINQSKRLQEPLNHNDLISKLKDIFRLKQTEGYRFFTEDRKELYLDDLIIKLPKRIFILSPKYENYQFGAIVDIGDNAKKDNILSISILITDKSFNKTLAGPRAIEINTNKDSIENLNTINSHINFMTKEIKLIYPTVKPPTFKGFLTLIFYVALFIGVFAFIEATRGGVKYFFLGHEGYKGSHKFLLMSVVTMFSVLVVKNLLYPKESNE